MAAVDAMVVHWSPETTLWKALQLLTIPVCVGVGVVIPLPVGVGVEVDESALVEVTGGGTPKFSSTQYEFPTTSVQLEPTEGF